MEYLVRATPLYNLLRFCDDEHLAKKVLDCGAGGVLPPLYLFYSSGYETAGIDIDEGQIGKADAFCKANHIQLNIKKGDMRSLDYADGSFPVVYSYNSIFHMRKEDILASINEMIRVLMPGGLCYFNLLSVEDSGYGEGEEIDPGEFVQEERGNQVIHAYFEDEEMDGSIRQAKIRYKEKRSIYIYMDDQTRHPVYLDYIIKKNAE